MGSSVCRGFAVGGKTITASDFLSPEPPFFGTADGMICRVGGLFMSFTVMLRKFCIAGMA